MTRKEGGGVKFVHADAIAELTAERDAAFAMAEKYQRQWEAMVAERDAALAMVREIVVEYARGEHMACVIRRARALLGEPTIMRDPSVFR